MTNSPLNDELLLKHIAQGHSYALEQLYDSYGRVVYSLAIKILKDPTIAEEIVQEAFIRIWQGARTYDSSRGRVSTWLLTITHNLCIDELRRRKSRPQAATSNRQQPDEDDPMLLLPDESAGVEEQVMQRSLSAVMREAIRTLPAEQYTVIEMAYFRGMTHTQIALQLKLPLGTAKTRMALALKKLKTIMQAQGYADKSTNK